MLEERKISQEDYLLLSNALKKKSVFANLENSILINPFKRIAGIKALLLGFILLVLMSILGSYANIYYDGVLGYLLPDGIKTTVKPNFFLLCYQNIIASVVLAAFFLLAALLYRKKRIRPIDFFGMVALSRYPLFISVIFTFLEKLIRPEEFKIDYSKGIELHFSVFGTVSNLLFTLCFIWQIITYFFALKEASGLEGKSLWISFIITFLVGDVFTMALTRAFI